MPNRCASRTCLAVAAVTFFAVVAPSAARPPGGIGVCATAGPCAWFFWPDLADLAAPGSGLAASAPAPLALLAPATDGVAIRPVLFLLGIVYEDAYFQGPSLAFYDQGGCHVANNPLFDMPAAFDNVVSSIDGGYSSCNWLIPYDLPGGAGEWPEECLPDCLALDEMDDRTSSLNFRHSL